MSERRPAQDGTVPLAALPVSTWSYSWEPEHVRHLGPMAQDWRAVLGLGDAEATIDLVDAHGLAVVAPPADITDPRSAWSVAFTHDFVAGGLSSCPYLVR